MICYKSKHLVSWFVSKLKLVGWLSHNSILISSTSVRIENSMVFWKMSWFTRNCWAYLSCGTMLEKVCIQDLLMALPAFSILVTLTAGNPLWHILLCLSMLWHVVRYVGGEALTSSQSDLQTYKPYRLSCPMFDWQQLTGYL